MSPPGRIPGIEPERPWPRPRSNAAEEIDALEYEREFPELLELPRPRFELVAYAKKVGIVVATIAGLGAVLGPIVGPALRSWLLGPTSAQLSALEANVLELRWQVYLVARASAEPPGSATRAEILAEIKPPPRERSTEGDGPQ